MLLHNFKYTFKIIMGQKAMIFWTFAFPLILGFFFNMAFSNIEKAENFDVIDVAVVDNDEYRSNLFLTQSLEYLGDKDNSDRMFNIKYTDEAEAKKLLEKNKVSAYLICEGQNNKVVISKNGTSQTIFKGAVEEISQSADIIEKKLFSSLPADVLNMIATGAMPDDAEVQQQIAALVSECAAEIQQNQQVNLKNISGEKLGYTVIEFYTLIAMTCLYGGLIGMIAIGQALANVSSNGKRVAMSPAKKRNVIISSLLAGYVVQIIGILLLFAFSVFILKVDFGDNLLLILLLALAGCLAGLTMGIAAGVLFKVGEGAKIGIIVGITMFFSFLSGMMGITMKYIIDKNVPIVNKINPAAMITDGLYSLYYYDTYDRFILNIVSLLIFSAVMTIISWRGLRRQQYDSI